MYNVPRFLTNSDGADFGNKTAELRKNGLVMYDIYGSDPNFGIDKSLTNAERGYDELLGLKKLDRIYAIFLTMGLHPAITPEVIKDLNTPCIKYRSLLY